VKKKILNIEGMTCSACSNGLERYLNKQNGIKEASVNLVMATAYVEYDENIIKEQDLNRFVKEAGFKSLGEMRKDGNNKKEIKFIIFFSILTLFLMYISMGDMIKLPIPLMLNKMENPKIYTTILFISSILGLTWGIDIIKNGIKNIIHKMPNMDSLVGIGVIVNLSYSIYNAVLIYYGKNNINYLFFESSIMIILFVKIGRFIDKRNKAKAVDAIKNLVMVTPKDATIIKDNKEIKVTINEIKKDDILICRPGEKIAVDGIVIKGQTHTDESFLTGESNPVSKKIGSKVMAGSINYDGCIEYRAENIGKDTNISHIVDLVVEATNTKAPISKIVDKISGYFVPSIFIIAIFSLILNLIITKQLPEAIIALVSVLVVACPCALGLATPLVMVVAIGNASKKGIVIKSGESLEAINNIDTVVFDKTGTLTKGKLEIVDEKYITKTSKEEVLKLLQSLEKKSNHPLAVSICKNAQDLYDVKEFKEISGHGITGKINGKVYFAGNKKLVDTLKINNNFLDIEEEFSKKGESIVYFGSEKNIIAIFGLRDEIKENVKQVVVDLKKLNKKVVMLSGDNEKVAQFIAKKLDINNVYSNISPQGKQEKIKELNNNKNVIMVGDGINDSPALKTATIGISVSNSTAISSDSSDIILVSENINRILNLFEIGNKTIKIIKENLFWALFYNVLMIPIATGLFAIKLNPMIASIAMTFSSLTVVLNSLRLRKI